MDNEVKQRNRRRKRAQRMQAQRANKVKDGDSAEDESPVREKPVRPPNRRKKSKEPLVEEDIIDGFAILGFRSFEDLETAIAIATSAGGRITVNTKATTREKSSAAVSSVANIEEKPKVDTGQRHSSSSHHISHPPCHNLLLAHGDAGTSDDSGRASERLTSSSVAPRDPDSSRDRLSDASSRCSSGKGYICDSEGEDDKGSDAGSILFASTPTPQRKHEFPGSGLPSGVPGGDSASPVPAPTSPCLAPPAPSPAPAALPPHSALPQPYSSGSPMTNHVITAAAVEHPTKPNNLVPATVATAATIVGATTPTTPASITIISSHIPQNTPSLPHSPTPSVVPQHQIAQTTAIHPPISLQQQQHQQQQQQLQQQQPQQQQQSHNQVVVSNQTSHSHTTHASNNIHSQSNHPTQQPILPPPQISQTANLTACSTPNIIGNSINNVCNQTSPHSQQMPPSVNHQSTTNHLGHSTTSLLNHQIPHNNSLSSPSQLTTSISHNTQHTIPHLTANTANCISGGSVSGIHHSIVNHALPPSHMLPAQPTHNLSNHPIQTHQQVSRASSPPPPLSAATPPASLPAALPQPATAPVVPPVVAAVTTTHHLVEQQQQPPQQSLPLPLPLPREIPIQQPHTIPNNLPLITSTSLPPPAPIITAPSLHTSSTNSYNLPNSTSNGIGSYHHQQVQSSSTFPAYPPLYAPYAASMRNSIPVSSPVSTPIQQHSSRTSSIAPTLPSPTITSQTPNISTSSINSLHVTPTITTSHNRELSATNNNNILTNSQRGTHSPRGHSPNRERDSYSSNVSSLSRGSVTPVSLPYSSSSLSVTSNSLSSSTLAFSKAWNTVASGCAPPNGVPSSVTSQLSPAAPRPTPPPVSVAAAAPPTMHPFPTPMFAPPLAPPPVSAASPLSLQTNSNPFSTDTLFQSNQDMLRRELDNRFLASQDRTLTAAAVAGVPGVGTPSYLRTEMHQHQHHHTHVHQHAAPILPPPPAPSAVVPSPSLFPSPLFKDIPKLGSVDSPFYRQNLGLSSYPGYSPGGLMHPGLGGPTPFVPPNHLPAFQPKKSGKWNAMHVRVAWEIYHHQQKQQVDLKSGAVASKSELLRPPSHVFPGGLVHPSRPPHDIPFHRGPPFETAPHPSSLFAAPPSHIASGVSPFSRYGSAFPNPTTFGLPPFPGPGRELPPMNLHDPWRSVSALQRGVASYPPPAGSWALKPDPIALERREQEERERIRRERERERKQQLEQQERERERERDRREKERREMERRELERLHQQRLAESKAAAAAIRERSPLRNGTTEDIRVKEEPRQKDDDVVMLNSRSDPRYHPYLRHPPGSIVPPPPRGIMPPSLGGGPLPSHFPPPPTNAWPPPGPDPFRDAYRFDPLRYNPIMEAMRAEEERVKMYGAYGSPHLRGSGKDPTALLHLRTAAGQPGAPSHLVPPQTKDDSSQSR